MPAQRTFSSRPLAGPYPTTKPSSLSPASTFTERSPPQTAPNHKSTVSQATTSDTPATHTRPNAGRSSQPPNPRKPSTSTHDGVSKPLEHPLHGPTPASIRSHKDKSNADWAAYKASKNSHHQAKKSNEEKDEAKYSLSRVQEVVLESISSFLDVYTTPGSSFRDFQKALPWVDLSRLAAQGLINGPEVKHAPRKSGGQDAQKIPTVSCVDTPQSSSSENGRSGEDVTDFAEISTQPSKATKSSSKLPCEPTQSRKRSLYTAEGVPELRPSKYQKRTHPPNWPPRKPTIIVDVSGEPQANAALEKSCNKDMRPKNAKSETAADERAPTSVKRGLYDAAKAVGDTPPEGINGNQRLAPSAVLPKSPGAVYKVVQATMSKIVWRPRVISSHTSLKDANLAAIAQIVGLGKARKTSQDPDGRSWVEFEVHNVNRAQAMGEGYGLPEKNRYMKFEYPNWNANLGLKVEVRLSEDAAFGIERGMV
ncbi:MAG: hypothetical protein M1814_005617 [Vezdaea aestivalis]|nr:MAG: hypothetical protein M1814_005617 [Vezdaea aestivalis]